MKKPIRCHYCLTPAVVKENSKFYCGKCYCERKIVKQREPLLKKPC